MIIDGKKWHYLPLRSFSALFSGITSSNMEIFTVETLFIHIAHIINLKNMKENVITMITVM